MIAGAKAYIGLVLVALVFGAGVFATRGCYTAQIARDKADIAQLSALLTRQNDAVKTWKAAAAEQARRLAIAEAKQSQIVEKWKTVVETVTQTVPGPATPCPEVSAWERIAYMRLLQAWQPSQP